MPTNLQGRTQYLSLAIFSQSVVSALLDFVDQNKSEHLESSLREALGSLDDINSGNCATVAEPQTDPNCAWLVPPTVEDDAGDGGDGGDGSTSDGSDSGAD